MKLVLIHGRAQGERKEAAILAEWRKGLEDGFAKIGAPLPSELEIRLPFYGKRLDELTAAAVDELIKVIQRGGAPSLGGQSFDFDRQLVDALAKKAGITDAEIEAQLTNEVRRRGPQHWDWVQAAARVLSERVPWLTESIIARFTADVHAYVVRAGVRRAINKLVGDAIPTGDPCIVVSHSLGTVVAYWLLTERGEDVSVPLFVTLGSPLGINTIRDALPRPLGVPKGVKVWINGSDDRDYVALYARLERPMFPVDIENISDISNPPDYPHGIAGYLSDERIAQRLKAQLLA